MLFHQHKGEFVNAERNENKDGVLLCFMTVILYRDTLLQGITLLQDAGTSDDSGRASERLTGSSVAPRDPDSSRDRLSDVRIKYCLQSFLFLLTSFRPTIWAKSFIRVYVTQSTLIRKTRLDGPIY